MSRKVLVTDSSERASLAIIRSLGKKGIAVTAADAVSFNAGFLSKYAKNSIIYPSPQENKTRFADSLLHLVKNENFDLLIPVTDFTMIPILERRDEFEKHVQIAAPSLEVAMKAFDKAATMKIAQERGIPCPKTILIRNFEHLSLVAEDLQYPVVVKPRMKIFWKAEQAAMLKVTSKNYAYSKEDLLAKYLKLTSEWSVSGIPSNFFLIQEFAKGKGYGVEALIANSNVKAIFVHERLREYPVKGGASTLRVSVKNDRLSELAVTMLNALKWEGVAMVEFKFDTATQTVNLMEVNGRFWGSLPLSINAGVDFPYLLYKCAMGEDFDFPSYKLGLIQRWLIPGDLLWLYSSIVDEGKIFSSVKEFLASSFVPDDIISPDDPKPVLGSIRTFFNSVLDVAKGQSNSSGEVLRRA